MFIRIIPNLFTPLFFSCNSRLTINLSAVHAIQVVIFLTSDEIRIKNWLNRAFYADKKIKALDMLVRQCRERAEGLMQCGKCNEKGRSDTVLNDTENAFIKLADIEQKYSRQKVELLNITDEISETVAELHDDDLETVLIHRYLLFHTVEQTAELMNYSIRATQYKHKKAIEKLCTLLHCFAP